MTHTMHAFDYLDDSDKHKPAPVCVVFGDEPFLKRLALKSLRQALTVGEDDMYANFDGDTVQWRDVFDEVATVTLFGGGGPRLVVVNDADGFVRQYRDRLERYVDRPKSSGVLVLDVTTWQSNTRLYKALDKSGLQIDCRAPEKASGKRKVLDEGRLISWLQAWSAKQHHVRLSKQAAALLLELVGTEFGLMDQDLAKLALFVEPHAEITPDLVQEVVGGWRGKTIWELLDSACDGDAAEAVKQLDRLLLSGDAPQALFGQISWSLRRFAAATRIFERAEREGRRIGLSQALQDAGFRPWPKQALQNAERQLKQMGRQRAGQLYRWLLEADLALKGTHSTPHRGRWILEQLFFRLAKQAPIQPR